jgi:hypothetical protein
MKLKEGLSDNEFKELILNILDDNSEYKKDQYNFLPIDNISRDGNMEKKYLRLQDYIRNKTRVSPKMWTETDEKLTEIINEVFSQIVEKKLCARGKKYIAKRKAAGEKSSAYLSGRAVKVCKGQMKG